MAAIIFTPGKFVSFLGDGRVNGHFPSPPAAPKQSQHHDTAHALFDPQASFIANLDKAACSRTEERVPLFTHLSISPLLFPRASHRHHQVRSGPARVGSAIFVRPSVLYPADG